jgi:retron-type reverse transcriptase
MLNKLTKQISIDSNQFGFRSGLCTLNAIESLVNCVRCNRDIGRIVVVVTLDISGAFDNLRWSKVLECMRKQNVAKKTYEIFKDFLSNRKVQLNLNGESITRYLTKGSPQGAIVSPTLWNLVMNELLVSLKKIQQVSCYAYADDLALVIASSSSKQIERILQKVSDVLALWSASQQVFFNHQKTEAMLVCSRR